MNDRTFYFALYSGLAYLTAYIAILVLIITIGLVVRTSSQPMPTATEIAFIGLMAALMSAEFLSIYKMYQLGKIIRKGLPYKDRPGLYSKKWPHVLMAIAVLSATVWDISLVLRVI